MELSAMPNSETNLRLVFCASLGLLLLLLQLRPTLAQTQCQNGGTFDYVTYTCTCTPDFYGENCETSFSSSNPCSNPSVPVLNDAAGSHSPGNTQPCSQTGCIDFSSNPAGWYRVSSPAGGVLTSACPDSPTACGSSYPFIVTNVVQESNANIRLSTARLTRVTQEGPVCYSSTSAYYPVRILVCASFNLYYLTPTSAPSHHYCIGNKKKCSAGLVSADGSGYEPCYNSSTCVARAKSGAAVPVMQQVITPKTNNKDNISNFNCTIQDSFETNITSGVLYRVFYRLTYHDATSPVILDCTTNDLTISPGGSATVSCDQSKILLPNKNIYGGTLECVVQAKCNSASSEYASQELASVPHTFEFIYRLIDNTTLADATVITPSQPVQLCLNVSKVPLRWSTNTAIRVTVRREAVIASDKIQVMLNPPASNDSSTSTMSDDPCRANIPRLKENYEKMCFSLVLLNTDEDGLIVHGLDGSKLAPMVEVNVYFQSSADDSGIYTAGNWVRLQSRDLVVNISSLYADELKDYLHVFSDPFFKPANSTSIYWTWITPGVNQCGVATLMRNTILPYEVQVKECSDVNSWFGHSGVVEVAIRYEYYVITLNSTGNTFQYSTRLLQNERSALPLTAAGLPRGVTIETTNLAARVTFDIYGTVMYFWAFVATNPDLHVGTSACIHNFVMSRKAMFLFADSCKFDISKFVINGLNAMDLMIIPGFYDTPNRVDGVMYRPGSGSWRPTDYVTMSSTRDMFSPNFVADRVIESLLKPTEKLDFCACTNMTIVPNRTTCAIKATKLFRKRRSIMSIDLPQKSPSSSANLLPPADPSVNITVAMATDVCSKFVQAMAGLNRAVTVSECSNAKGILGQVDFMTQFKAVCVQYAVVLNSYNYTEPIFNSIAGQCLKSLSYHVPTVQNRPSVLVQMQEEMCPNNCSGNGVCASGLCVCKSGFTGSACQTASSAQSSQVTMVNLYNTGVLCSTRSCSAVYLNVSPYLKSASPSCIIRSTEAGYQEQRASESLAGNIVSCSMAGVQSWLKTNKKLYIALKVNLTGTDWSSSNTVSILAYQETCKDGTAVCSSASMTCHVAGTVGTPPDSNRCEEPLVVCCSAAFLEMSLRLALGLMVIRQMLIRRL